MKTTLTTSAVFSLVLLIAGVAAAETFVTPSSQANTGYATGYVPGGYGGFGWGYHSSTYEEGVLNGLGTLARSYGEANYMNSLARINNQEAYNRYLQNREKRTETYFRMQQINRAARESQRSQPLSREQYVELAKRLAPQELSPAEYDRTLGRLTWPAVLTEPQFAAERDALDRAFVARTPADAGAATAFHSQVRQLALTMEAKLHGHIDQMGAAEYLAAKSFLQSLSYESQLPHVVRALAAR